MGETARETVRDCKTRGVRLRTRILLILVATNIFDSFAPKRDLSIRATQTQRSVGASKAREAPPRNKRIMWTRFDVFEYLISRALKPSHHSRLTTDQTLSIIEVELTKDHVIHEVTSACMTDRFPRYKRDVFLHVRCPAWALPFFLLTTFLTSS